MQNFRNESISIRNKLEGGKGAKSETSLIKRGPSNQAEVVIGGLKWS